MLAKHSWRSVVGYQDKEACRFDVEILSEEIFNKNAGITVKKILFITAVILLVLGVPAYWVFQLFAEWGFTLVYTTVAGATLMGCYRCF